MASDGDSVLQNWLSLTAVQALFAADLPWYASKLSKAGLSDADRSSIQDFRVFFRFDVKDMSSLLRPDREFNHLSEDTTKELEIKLDKVLRLLESQIDDEVLAIQSRHLKRDKKEFEPPVESGITSTLFWAVSKIRSFTSINTSISASTPPTIGDTETKTVVNGVYPKLKALKALLENLDDTVDPVFKYGYLINLGNSKDEYKKALKETEQFNEFLASLDDAKSSGTPAQKSPVNSARVAEIDRARDASHRLFNALAHLPTECGVSHRAMLHLTGFKQRDRGSLRPAYDMFVSCCPKSLEWLESHCLISDPIDYPEATSIVELCGAVQDYRQTPKALRLILGGEHLFDARAKDGCFEYPKFRHHLSLGTLLDKGCFKSPYDGGLFTTRSKRLLVLNLARCLLCLFGSKWLQREWKASDIVFLCEPGGDHLVDMHRPYILSTLSPAVPPLREIRDSSSVPHHPAILSFAKLLVEIERGRRITKGEYELSAGRENQWLTISTILSRQLFESLTGYYMNAVKSCLDFARPAGYGSNSEVDYIYQNIVMPLEKELSHYPGAQLENAELRLLSTNLNMTSTGRPATAASMACHLPTAAITEPPSPTLQTRIVQDVRLGTLANPTETTLVLFDDNEDNGPESRINRFRASEFLDDLEDSENGSEVKIDSQTTIISSKAKPETHQSKANENSPLASPTTGKSSRRKLDHKNTKSSGSTLSIDRPTVRSRSVPPPDQGVGRRKSTDSPCTKKCNARDRASSSTPSISSQLDNCTTSSISNNLGMLFSASIENQTDKWFKSVEATVHSFLNRHQQSERKDKIRIAVLDTGVAIADSSSKKVSLELRQKMIAAKGEAKRLDNGLNPLEDDDGHGTDCFCLLMRVCPYAVIYPYRVVRKTGEDINPKHVKQALDHAIDKRKANIISMSFGWEHDGHEGLRETIAGNKDVLLFAATSNDGRGIKYPARAEEVIAVDAAHSNGKPSSDNPSQSNEKLERFTALGVDIQSVVQTERKSGTSFATPVAAGTAALLLEFAKQPPLCHSQKVLTRLNTRSDMLRVFREILCWENGDFKFIDISKFEHFCGEDEYGKKEIWFHWRSRRYQAAKTIVNLLRKRYGENFARDMEEECERELQLQTRSG